MQIILSFPPGKSLSLTAAVVGLRCSKFKNIRTSAVFWVFLHLTVLSKYRNQNKTQNFGNCAGKLLRLLKKARFKSNNNISLGPITSVTNLQIFLEALVSQKFLKEPKLSSFWPLWLLKCISCQWTKCLIKSVSNERFCFHFWQAQIVST